MDIYWNMFTMHGPMNVKFLNNTSKWQMEFNSAFKGLIVQVSLPYNNTGRAIVLYNFILVHQLLNKSSIVPNCTVYTYMKKLYLYISHYFQNNYHSLP
jgi:hypothetical protein